MSIVVAVKYKDGIAVACDTQSTKNGIKTNGVRKFKYFEDSNTLLGIAGYLRDCNVISDIEEIIPYKDLFHKINITEEYVISVIIPFLYEQFLCRGRIDSSGSFPVIGSSLLYITKDKIFTIDCDFGVMEITDNSFFCVGSGEELTRGYLSAVGDTSELNEEAVTELIHQAITIGCENCTTVNDEIFIKYIK